MEMVYNSESFVVVRFEVPAEQADAGASPVTAAVRGGFEIVDKLAGKEIFLEGLVAETFKAGVQSLVDNDPTPEAFDEYIARFTVLAQQPVVIH